MRKFVLPALAGSLLLVQATLGAAQDAGEKALRERLQKTFPGSPVTEVRKTPLKGIYEVSIGNEIGYVSEDGKYLLHGDLIELGTQHNLTEQRRQLGRKNRLARIGEQDMIIFSPKKPKHTVTVFTDIDCGYCRLLHKEIKGYQEQGIAVRYLFFPRAGLNSESSRKADAVWCAKDRRDALTRAKQGETLPAGQCKTPVASHYQAGIDVGVRGTPAIITEDGRMIPGYQPPAELRRTLDNPQD
ncbi:MAG TPA: DsbC family protein [Nevskiales bacterium]|nr:DsbC family protein [Nevskiales bacterium]